MKHKFVLMDGSNLFFRQIKMTNPALGIDNAIGMSLHMIMTSMKKEYNTFGASHCVFFLEGRSWRKDIYPDYKGNRKVAFAQQTEQEQEDHKILVESFDGFAEYLDTKTNVTVLQNPGAEADDMIAIFVESHPDDEHVLVSSDSDFFQLLRYPNIMIYDPVKDIQIRRDGIFNDKGDRLSFTLNGDAKIKVGTPDPSFVVEDKWYEYALFLKCIRGDKTDYIFSAYPGVREKGTKTKIGVREAYDDVSRGYSWTNFMQQRWVDHNGNEHQVKDKYEFNRTLIDLACIPEKVKVESLSIIAEEIDRKNIPAVEIGHAFMKFCGKYNLPKIGSNADAFMPMLKSKYSE